MLIQAFLALSPGRLVLPVYFLRLNLPLLRNPRLDPLLPLLIISTVLDRPLAVLISRRSLQVPLLLLQLLLACLGDIIFLVIDSSHLKLVLAELFFTFTFEFGIEVLLEFLSFSF